MSDIRYGIFLRPDAATCWNVTQVTTALNKQFGLVSAGAFPPHATIVGNLNTAASAEEVIAALDPVFAEVAPIPVYNSGIERNSDRYGYNVNNDASGQRPNAALAAVAEAVHRAVLPLWIPPQPQDFLTPSLSAFSFAAHLSLAAHELAVDNSLSDQVGDFLEGLPLQPPASFDARWYSLFEFTAPWAGHWWEQMTWRHLRSWDVANNDTIRTAADR